MGQIVRRNRRADRRLFEEIVKVIKLIPQECIIRGSIDHVVQSFVSTQLKHLDAVAVELACLQARVRDFAALSDSIVSFVEEDAQSYFREGEDARQEGELQQV